MMLYSGLVKVICYMLFFTGVLLPAVAAEVATNIDTKNTILEAQDTDMCIEADEYGISQEDSDSDEAFFSFLDKPQEVISSGVEIFAKSLDEFFSEDKVFYDTSGTYLRLRMDATLDDYGDMSYTGNVRLKLRLPNTKKKLRFTFESDIDKRQGDVVGQTENTPATAEKDKDYFAGVQASLGKKTGWQFKPSLGLRLGSDVELYTRLRLKRRYEFDKWSIYWGETPFWFNSTGVGLDSYLEFNRKISKDSLFRIGSFARWTKKTDYFLYNQSFSMFHTLSKKRILSYYVTFSDVSKSAMYSRYYLVGATYRQNIHKDYLFVELVPQIIYQEKNDFNAEHSLILRLEIIFKK